MTPIDWAKRPLAKYADFSGRAPRAEYWWFALLMLVATVVASLIDSMIGTGGMLGVGMLALAVNLAVLIPSVAVSVRRLHDTDRSGWWLLIVLLPLIGAIVLLVFFVLEGTKGDNRFGPNEYAGEPAHA